MQAQLQTIYSIVLERIEHFYLRGKHKSTVKCKRTSLYKTFTINIEISEKLNFQKGHYLHKLLDKLKALQKIQLAGNQTQDPSPI